MLTLLDYFEQYLKQEGLSGKIPDYRKRIALRLPPKVFVLAWFGGTWALSVLFHWLFIGLNKLVFAVLAPCGIFVGMFLIIVVFYAIRQIKSKSKLSPSASTIGNVYLIYYPLFVILAFGIISRNLAGTVFLAVSYVVLVLILLMANSTYLLQIAFEWIRVTLGIFTKSISTLLTLFPILLVVVLLSIFSQDLWFILGNISWPRLLLTVFMFSISPFILSYLKLNEEAWKLEGEYPSLSEILHLITNIKFFSDRFDKGLISDRECSKLENDLNWRDMSRLRKNNRRWLHKIMISRLEIFSEITGLLLFLAFAIYFIVVFYLLISPRTISDWTGIHLTYKALQFSIGNAEWFIPSTTTPLIKVSITLAVIVTLTARISALTDSDIRTNVFSWLERKARDWKTILVAYDCALTPNYQELRYRVKNNKIFNADILTKPGLDKQAVEVACRSMALTAPNSVFLIIVTAFEKEEGKPYYDYGFPGKHWQLLINRSKRIDKFSDLTIDFGDIPRIADDLGFNMLDQNKEIPDAWFGNDPLAVKLGKQVWESDPAHNLILHPYVHKSSKHFIIEITITQKFEKSSPYKELIKNYLNMSVKTIQDFETISIQLFYRNTMDVLAWLDYTVATNQIIYKDKLSPKYIYSSPQKWIKNT
jgi:hypothetical protein